MTSSTAVRAEPTTAEARPRPRVLRGLAGRVVAGVMVVWAAYTLAFVVLYSLPSDPAALAAEAAGQNPDPDLLRAVREAEGIAPGVPFDVDLEVLDV